MPDLDRVHSRLAYKYQRTYKELCEGAWSLEDIGYRALRPLRESLKEYGDPPVRFLQKVTPVLKKAAAAPLLADRRSLNEQINNFSIVVNGPKRGIELAKTAAKQVLHNSVGGMEIGDVELAVMHRYIMNVYDEQFYGRVLLQEPFNGADRARVAEDSELLREVIHEFSRTYARQAKRKGSVGSLRRPNNPLSFISLYDNLLNGDGHDG